MATITTVPLLRRSLWALTAALAVEAASTSSYSNPVLAQDFPDPTVMRTPTGAFYVYGTMGSGHNFQVANSSDLVNWSYLGEAMPRYPSWGDANNRASWAPDVQYHNNSEAALGPGYYMYFAMRSVAGYMCIGVAFSVDPSGPFSDARAVPGAGAGQGAVQGGGSPLWCGDKTDAHTIDPKSFDDPVSGDIYLYYGSDFAPLQAIRLSPNRTSIADSGPRGQGANTPVVLLNTSGTAPYESLIEGSWVYYRQGAWYFMYSGNNCCGPTAAYAVMVAVSTKSALGPFTKMGTAIAAQGGDSTIMTAPLASGYRFAAPGHNSLITDDAGQDWLMYHAYDMSAGRGQGTGRMLLLDRLQYVQLPGGGSILWPVLATANGSTKGQPAIGPVPAPVVTAAERR